MCADSVIVRTGPGGVREVRWSRPRAANAFDEPLIDGLLDAVTTAVRDSIRLLVLCGEDGRFSAGFDLRTPADDRSLAWRFARCEELLAKVRDFPGITLASVTGPAYGAGADLVSSCDYRLGDETARFRFPGPRFGVVLGTHRIREVVGRARAMDILLRNETVDARTALHDGLLTDLLEAHRHSEFVNALAADVDDLDGETLRALLRAIRPTHSDASSAALARSTHRPGLAERIEQYRSKALG